jgi:DNA repair protein RecN (Recombination protein N)
MLSCLRIRDLAIIDELELELGSGLNVLTGETGAGKSILVSALELVLGGKGRPELVRSGAKEGEVEALFVVQGDARLARELRELDLDGGGEGAEELVVRRVLSASGRTRGFLNGRLVPQQVLARITRGLTDISSQHEHHTLSDPGTHLGYLDSFARVNPLRERLGRAYLELRQAAALLHDCETRGRDREAREAQLQAQLQELEDAGVGEGAGKDGGVREEELELEQRCRRLRSVEALLRLTGEAAELLYERDDSLVDGLAQAGRRIAEAAEIDVALAPLAAQLELLRGQLGDAARELGRHVRGTRPDPEALQRAEERLYQLAKLKRRYGGSLEGVLACFVECQAELEALSRHAETSEALALALARSRETAEALARELSAERRLAAGRLGKAISQELDSLGMGGARIHVSLRPLASGAVTGSGAVGRSAVGSGAVGRSAMGSGAVGRGAMGSGAVGRGAMGSGAVAGVNSDGCDTAGGGTAGCDTAGCGVGNSVAGASAGGGSLAGGGGAGWGEFLVDGVPLSADGLERAEFLIAPNRGEEARSLHRVASGGELSRAMLAIKCVLADLGPAGMYAFDEIDTGVGGAMAEIIGRKVRSVARHRQVLCITHLPQIAVFADQHFKVEKFVRGERTLSRVRRLSSREQREEIARMLGGVEITAKTRAAARELLHQARRVA